MIAAEPRHRWRQRAAAAGVAMQFGGALPHGRRLAVQVADGAVVAISEESARWRGRLLLRETPAVLSAEDHATISAAAVALVGDATAITLDVVWDSAQATLISVRRSPTSAPEAGCTLSATITADAPWRGRLVGLSLPPEARCRFQRGELLEVQAGDVLVSLDISAEHRDVAYDRLSAAVAALRLDGPPHDAYRVAEAIPRCRAGLSSARDLDALTVAPAAFTVIHPGLLTTVQDWPGRQGHWEVGVPPSGPFDDRAFRLANELVGNGSDAAGLEMALLGPTLRFLAPAVVCLTGPERSATLDGRPFPLWRAVAVPAGAVLACGAPTAGGCRGYLAVRHGIDTAPYLGSRATFDLGGFGGHAGRPLAVGDRVPFTRPSDDVDACPPPLPAARRPSYPRAWTITVQEGPHGAPEFLTAEGMAELYAATYTVHHNSNRTGVRLVGPKPQWARRDGGEAGLHPSNIHDNAYAIGAIDLTGDMPILLGPDGPSLGGFVCPAVTVDEDRWKLGQLRSGDTVRFAPRRTPAGVIEPAILGRQGDVVVRRQGDANVLVEVGEAVLDIALRLRIHLLHQAVAAAAWPGVLDLTPGIRSLQVHVDPSRLPLAELVPRLLTLVEQAGRIDEAVVPSRTVHLPLSWDDPATRKAIEIYQRSVNPDAPWCPSNIEFIRRINGLDAIEQVFATVFAARYLVLGLGDVYLGAPVATPLDPRHRLVTTKYNPARTWTPQNAVGIGGAYMCIYGMEGPGGYQFVGRTVPVWDTWGATPCLLRHFDVVRFFPVDHEELLRLRAAPYRPRIEDGTFAWRDYQRFLAENAGEIEDFRSQQRAAFAAERGRWEAITVGGSATKPGMDAT